MAKIPNVCAGWTVFASTLNNRRPLRVEILFLSPVRLPSGCAHEPSWQFIGPSMVLLSQEFCLNNVVS